MTTDPAAPTPVPPDPAEGGPAAPHHHAAGEFVHEVSAKARQSWRKWRWLVRIVVGTPVVLGLILFALMHSPLVGWVVARKVQSLSGCRFESGRAYIGLDGTLYVREPMLSAPGLSGHAARLMSAEGAEFMLDWSGVLTGRVECTQIRLSAPEFLVSIGADGKPNISAAAAAMPPSSGGGALPPAIEIINGAIVFGEHDSTGTVAVLKKIRVEGAFTPTRADRPVYALRLYELVESMYGPSRGMIVDGRVHLDEGSLRLRLVYLPLESWRPEAVPSAYRDLWARLNVQGEVREALLEFTPDAGLALDMIVSEVSMNALIPTEESFVGPPKDLVLRDVSGRIRLARAGLSADLTGALGEQAGRNRVTIRTQGLDLDSALTARIFGQRVNVSKSPEFLPYVPPTVREYMAYFSGPTAEVTAVAIILRGPPVNGVPAEFQVRGELAFDKGAAAFHKFPYPFHDMAGRVEFDENTIRILNIRGRGPTGATLTAQGLISPLTDNAGVDVTVRVSGAPLDEHLISAIQEDRRRVVEAIFSGAAYESLLAKSLLRLPNQDARDGTRAAPPFALGGTTSIDVRVERKEGPEGDWKTTVDVRIPQAGILPARFPLPIVGHDLHVRITDDDARLLTGEFSGLAGGKAEVRAEVSLFEGDSRVTRPDVNISATGIPVDALMLNALPGDAEAHSEDGDSGEPRPRWSARRLIEELGVSGRIDAGVTLLADLKSPDPANPDVDYEISLTLDSLQARPRYRGEPSGLSIEELSGAISLRRDRLLVSDARGRVVRRPAGGEEGAQAVPVGLIDIDARMSLGDGASEEPGASPDSASIHLEELQLAEPFERVLNIFSTDAAGLVAEVRDSFSPRGAIDADVNIAGAATADPATSPSVRVRLQRTREFSIAALEGRLAVDLHGGVAELDLPGTGSARLEADDARVTLRFEGAEAGTLLVDGYVSIDPKSGSPVAPSNLQTTLRGWSLESPLLPSIVRRLGDDSVAARFRELAFAGRFDAGIAITDAVDGRSVVLAGFVQPESLAFSRRGRRTEIPSVTGRVSFEADPTRTEAAVGTIDGLVLSMDDWRGWMDGNWSVEGSPDARSLRLDTTLGLSAERVDERVLSMLPESVASALEALELKINGPLELFGGELATVIGGPTHPDSIERAPADGRFAGRIEAVDVSLNPGVSIRAPSAIMNIDWPDAQSARANAARAAILIPSATVASVEVDRVNIQIARGLNPDEIALPVIEAGCHGGRIVGEAHVLPGRTLNDRAAYDFSLLAAGIRFAPVLAELTRAGAAAEFVGPLPDERLDPDRSRGQIDARMWISGIAGDPRSRMGEGAIRVAHGQVIRLPIIFPLMQVSNFVLPGDDRFDELEAQFRFAGARAIFDRIDIRSRTITFVGGGSVRFPDLELDMHFNSRSNLRVPLISGLFESIRNEIVTTSIRGTLLDPDVGTEPFMGTRRLLGLIDEDRNSVPEPPKPGSAAAPAP